MSSPIQMLVNGVEAPLNISTQIELRENGVAQCTLIADNLYSKAYLETLHIGDTLTIKGIKAQDLLDIVLIDWNSVYPCFTGTIQELSPILSISGHICRTVAFNYGFPLKQTRTVNMFGYIYPIEEFNPVYSYDASINNGWTVRGSRPYINGYSFYHCLYSEIASLTYNTGPSDNNASIGAFNFFLDQRYAGGKFITNNPSNNQYGCLLHIVTGCYSTANGISDSVTITPYWTTDDMDNTNPTWHNFTTSLTDNKFVVSSSAPSGGATLGNLNVFYGGYFIPYWESYALSGHDTGLGFRGYVPILDVGSHQPPSGWDLVIDVTNDLPYWNPNFRVKLSITNSTGNKAGGVSIAMMYLQLNFEDTSGKSMREIIAGGEGIEGIIPHFVNQSLPFNINGNSTIINTGYYPIGTDYIYKDSSLISFLLFPYEDSLTCIQDVIKYGSGLNFLNTGGGGYHWRIDTLGNLLMAPVGSNHHVTGIDGNHYVDAVPNTIPWVARPYSTPIKIAEDMITQDLQEEAPLANFVMVAGKFQFPLNNDICRGRNFNSTLQLINYNNINGVPQAIGFYGEWVMAYVQQGQVLSPPSSQELVLLPSEAAINEPCLEFHTGTGGVTSIWCYPLTDNNGNLIDFTKLMGYNTVPNVTFWLKHGGYIDNVKVRFYLEETDINGNGKGIPKFDTYFEYYITNLPDQDRWGYITIDLPNLITLENFGNWNVQSLKSYWAILGLDNPATIDWSDFSKVKYFSIAFDTAGQIYGSTPYVRIAELSFNGTVIRAAYDQSSISKYGCRMLSIKDSFAQTDTLTNTENNPLGLECLYELLRHNNFHMVNGEKKYGYITGEIKIEFDPAWLDGQQVWLQTEQTLDGTNRIDQWFRITRVIHDISDNGAFTRLKITNDLTNSLSIDTTDVYTVIMRSVNPDFQSRTYGSLKSHNDFDLGLPVIAIAHNS